LKGRSQKGSKAKETGSGKGRGKRGGKKKNRVRSRRGNNVNADVKKKGGTVRRQREKNTKGTKETRKHKKKNHRSGSWERASSGHNGEIMEREQASILGSLVLIAMGVRRIDGVTKLSSGNLSEKRYKKERQTHD